MAVTPLNYGRTDPTFSDIACVQAKLTLTIQVKEYKHVPRFLLLFFTIGQVLPQ